jgi:hypothetical protein
MSKSSPRSTGPAFWNCRFQQLGKLELYAFIFFDNSDDPVKEDAENWSMLIYRDLGYDDIVLYTHFGNVAIVV